VSRNQHEFRIQCALADLLRRAARPDVFWFAIPNGEARSAVTGARIKQAGGRPGLPDLCFLIGGLCLGLELKTAAWKEMGIPKGRLSDEQLEVGHEWTAAGGIYAVAYGFDQAVEILGQWGVWTAGVVTANRGDKSVRRAAAA